MIGSILAIGFLSFIVWAHHMFVTGMNPFLGSVFVFTTLLIAIPSAVKVFNYITTLWKGSIVFTPAMLFAIGLVSTFITGGVTGIILGRCCLGYHNTRYLLRSRPLPRCNGTVRRLRYVRRSLSLVPKNVRKDDEHRNWDMHHFWITIVGAYGVFFPMHFVGLAGAPRRYYDYSVYGEFDVESYNAS